MEHTKRNLISMKEVIKRTSLSRTAINKRRKAGKFPTAVMLTDVRFAFVASEVDEWIEARIAERDALDAA